MCWIRDRWTVLQISLGFRRFLLVPIFGAVVAGVDWAAGKWAETDLGHLIDVPSRAAAEKLGIALHDHLVVGKDGYNSFKTMGLL